MIQASNTRRHTDGSIDLDFYRRDAATRRRMVQRLVIRRCANALRDTTTAVVSTIGIALRHRAPPRKNFG